jgi:hypothetical protein
MTKTDETEQLAAHTPEPWDVSENPLAGYGDNGPNFRIRADDETIAILPTYVRVPDDGHTDEYLKAAANGRRICATVNACQGIKTEALEQGIVRQLVEALESLYNWLTPDWQQSSLGDKARAAIAKATGRAA